MGPHGESNSLGRCSSSQRVVTGNDVDTEDPLVQGGLRRMSSVGQGQGISCEEITRWGRVPKSSRVDSDRVLTQR